MHKTDGGGLGIFIGSTNESYEKEHPLSGFMHHQIKYTDPQVCMGIIASVT